MKWIRNKIKTHFDLYDINDLQIGGHCGCCGVWVKNEICPKIWGFTLCGKCLQKGSE